jgi:hypothetical protein
MFIKIDDIAKTIKNDKTDDKWIIFVYAQKTAKAISDIVGKDNCMFVRANSKNIAEIISTNTFSKKVLITTCVLDNGVNIKDDSIKHIVIMDMHKTRFIQMLGRIRYTCIDGEIYANDLNLYIPRLSVKSFSNMLNTTEKHLEMVELYREDKDKFNMTYNRDFNKLPKYLFYHDSNENRHINIIGLYELYNNTVE